MNAPRLININARQGAPKTLCCKVASEPLIKFRKLLLDANMTPQDVFTNFIELCANNDNAAIKILNRIAVITVRKEVQKYYNGGAPIDEGTIDELDHETLYSLIEKENKA